MEAYAAELETQLQNIVPDDSMQEAGRKILLADLIKMLKHEAGARSGADIEDVHDMRVATRRMRSALQLFASHYKSKPVAKFNRRLRKVARVLGAVRDLDVLIQGLEEYRQSLTLPRRASHKRLSEEEKTGRATARVKITQQRDALGEVLAVLLVRRDEARTRLIEILDSRAYRRFIEKFGTFLTTNTHSVNNHTPYPVSLLLPSVIYQQVMAVRIHDHEVESHTTETLHALRVECKRLRYTVSFFSPILGKELDEFIDELKYIQDHLGRLNDVVVVQRVLANALDDLGEIQAAALHPYLDKLSAEQVQLQDSFVRVWQRFNSKAVQQKLALAVAGV
jgi:CHAD domain-containing protein